MRGYEYQPKDCPNCGKPKSATMLSNGWGHSYSCCSESCGRSFVGTKNYWVLELDAANARATEALAGYRRAYSDAERALAAITDLEVREAFGPG